MIRTVLSTLALVAALPTLAAAADLPPMPAPLPVFSWTGVYTGSFLGYGSLEGRADGVCDPTSYLLDCRSTANISHPDGHGLIAGSEIGYNYELPSGLLLGVSGDYQFTRLRGFGEADARVPLRNGYLAYDTNHVGESLDDLASLRGRIGYAFGRTLLYATGGLAAGRVTLNATRTENYADVGDSVLATHRDWQVGWMAGGGLEYAFSDHLSAKFEGDYFDLGTRTDVAPDRDGLGLSRGARIGTEGFLLRAGLDYHFGNTLPFFGLLNGGLAAEGDGGVPSPWAFESGLRYFYSVGSHDRTLFSPGAGTTLVSRVRYEDAETHAGETFARLDHRPTGLFLKGTLGSGDTVSGTQHDEDFPPTTVPYSSTTSAIKSGDLAYATADIGYNLWQTERVRVGGFLGYSYYADTFNSFGCAQTTASAICNPAIAGSAKVLSEDEAWNAFRVGGTLDANWNRFRVTLDAAYLPVASFTGFDHHWLRPDINPKPQTVLGDGYELEGVLSYAVTRDFSLGVGGRYWTFSGKGTTDQPFFLPEPVKIRSERYGGFVQAAYRLPAD